MFALKTVTRKKDNPPKSPSRILLREAITGMRRQKIATLSFFVILLMVLAVSLADLLAPYPPLQQNLNRILEGPSPDHLLGTDALGRDILSRLLHGGQPALSGILISLLFFVVVGVTTGLLAGYLRGWTDRIISVIVDVFMALPTIIILLAVLAVFSQNMTAAMFTFGILASANLTRIVRGAVLAIREELYVDAAMVSGITPLRIMRKHIFPGVVGPVLVQASLFSGIALGIQTGLGFLGVADRPPQPSWGGMISEASKVMANHGFFLLATGFTVIVMTFAFGFLGDGLRDIFVGKRQTSGTWTLRRPKSPRKIAPEVRPDSGMRLSVRNYSVIFQSSESAGAPVVNNISFDLQEGEILGLVGESGSGKTVTAKSLLGLLPSNGHVSAGQAYYEGRDITELSEEQYASLRGKHIGLVSQEPMVALDPCFTVGSQLLEVLAIHHRGSKTNLRDRAVKLLERVRLPDPHSVMKMYPHELSGGMAQRVVIAIALAGDPRILIADEPTTALDVTVQAEILDLLRALREETGMSVLLVTHDLGVVADLCDRVIVMKQGELVESGGVEDIFYRPTNPYTKRLLENTPSIIESTTL